MAKLYKNLTIAARMEMFITKEMGFKPIPSKNKYKMFEREVVSNGVADVQYLFLGKNGACRTLTGSKNASASHSRTDAFLAALKTYEIKEGLI